MQTAILSIPTDALGGNRTTALRWALRLRSMGWDVRRADRSLARAPIGKVELIVALHAVHSQVEVQGLLAQHPTAKLVVACTGTDIYELGDEAQPLLERADRLIVLQAHALEELSPAQRARAVGSPGHNGDLSKQLLKVLAGLLIATSRDVRDIAGSIFRTYLLDATHDMAKKLLAIGKEYYETVKLNPKSHDRGPPHLHL